MKMNEYQELAMRTASNKNKTTQNYILNAALGLNGESGEIADAVKKSLFQGHDLQIKELAKELGDVMWYVALGCKAIGYTMEEVAKMNIEKLKSRYPNGFSEENSINRED